VKLPISPLVAVAALAASAQAEVVENRDLHETLDVDTDAPHIVVRNVIGSVRVLARDVEAVDMRATETIRGDLRSDVERARQEVGLRVEQDDSGIAFRVRRLDGACDAGCGGKAWDGYSVRYDIELHVPQGASLDISTVNDGDVTVERINGNFTLKNVNGGVYITDAAGGGRVSTVNGPIDAEFTVAPHSAMSFETVNGPIDASFPPAIDADLAFDTLHGDILTDFDAAPVTAPSQQTRRSGRDTTVYRLRRQPAVRVGNGGPTLSFKTLNGDITVRRHNP
jgi:hypothetical protein